MRTRIKRLIKDIAAVMAGFLLVVALFTVSTTPSIAGPHQQVQITYRHDAVTSRSTCGKANEGFEGDAVIGHEWLFKGGMSVAWCWRIVQGPLATDLIVGTPTVNTWADARFGWSFDGISSKVKGHGTNCVNGHCWEYYYYRYYFKFTRGTKLLQQTCTPYINITVRGNGTYEAGHTDGGVC